MAKYFLFLHLRFFRLLQRRNVPHRSAGYPERQERSDRYFDHLFLGSFSDGQTSHSLVSGEDSLRGEDVLYRILYDSWIVFSRFRKLL